MCLALLCALASWEVPRIRGISLSVPMQIKADPEGPHIQPLGNWDPEFLLQYGIWGPNSLIVVYMDPLGEVALHYQRIGTLCKQHNTHLEAPGIFSKRAP